jgi:hypothetical protein
MPLAWGDGSHNRHSQDRFPSRPCSVAGDINFLFFVS